MQKVEFMPKLIFEIELIHSFNHFGHAWPHQLKKTEQICNFYGSLTTFKNQIYSSTHSWDEADSLFGETLGMPDHTYLKWSKDV